jgi:hypothetical protein
MEPMTATTDAPTHDSELYSFATMRIEQRAAERINDAIDTHGLSHWFGEQLRHAYNSGLRDGYVQGRHDNHRANGGEPTGGGQPQP